MPWKEPMKSISFWLRFLGRQGKLPFMHQHLLSLESDSLYSILDFSPFVKAFPTWGTSLSKRWRAVC